MKETLHEAPDGIVYRWARELHGRDGRPAVGAAEVLRILDLDDQTRAAALYPGFETDINNHGAPGTMLTREIDSLVVKAKLPDDETAQDDALRGSRTGGCESSWASGRSTATRDGSGSRRS